MTYRAIKRWAEMSDAKLLREYDAERAKFLANPDSGTKLINIMREVDHRRLARTPIIPDCTSACCRSGNRELIN